MRVKLENNGKLPALQLSSSLQRQAANAKWQQATVSWVPLQVCECMLCVFLMYVTGRGLGCAEMCQSSILLSTSVFVCTCVLSLPQFTFCLLCEKRITH